MGLEEIVPFAAAMVVAGVAAGLLAGLLGVGGGIVTVPVLFQILTLLDAPEGHRMHVAVATSLAAIIPTSVASARSHRRRGAVDAAVLKTWLVPILAGAGAGTALATSVRGPVLSGVFAAGALGVAVYMLWRREGAEGAEPRLPPAVLQWPIAAGIGGLSAMMGIGGGTFAVPVLRHFGFAMRPAVGTASAFGIAIAAPAAAGYALSGLVAEDLPPLSLGYVNLAGLAFIAPLAMATAPLGARIAHRIRPDSLRLAFVAFLLVTSVRMGLSLL